MLKEHSAVLSTVPALGWRSWEDHMSPGVPGQPTQRCYQWVVSEDPSPENLRSLVSCVETHRLQSCHKVLLRVKAEKYTPQEEGERALSEVALLSSSYSSSTGALV
jgi:hypothetical protein